MLRTWLETAGVVLLIALALEVMHYRNAVLDANVDRNRAWKTVVELRHACEQAKPGHPRSATDTLSPSRRGHNAAP
ncbi:MAG TPA: hypothetical protein VFA79_10895 [Myxococcales bacterium]|nr:hypothetical protein [Myxococcales bacterium]